MVLRHFAFDRFLRGAVTGVATKDPEAEAANADPRHEEREAHPEPGGNPFAGKEVHHSIITKTMIRPRL